MKARASSFVLILTAVVHALDDANTTTCGSSTEEVADCDLQMDLHWSELTGECRLRLADKGWTIPSWEADEDWDELPKAVRRMWIDGGGDQESFEKEGDWEDLPDSRKEFYESEGMGQDGWDSDREWDDLPKHRQKYWEEKGGWTRDAWEKHDASKLLFVNEEELEWEYLSENRREYWLDRGFSEDTWDTAQHETKHGLDKHGGTFNPRVLKVDIPELSAITLDSLGEVDTVVGLKDGDTDSENESYVGEMHMKDYIKALKEGTKLYLMLEDIDPYKKDFQKVVGEQVRTHLFDALNNSSLHTTDGIFTPEEWDEELYDWAMFMGSKGTKTAMHYDTDLFNFLWVSEGRKRVILIPNDERTKDTFQIESAFSGTAFTGVDILSRDYVLPEFAVEVEIGPGEGIYFPYICWHAVENLEPTLAFGLRMKDGW